MNITHALAALAQTGPEHIHTVVCNSGAYGTVYRVGDGMVIKIGLIDEDEVDAQRHLAAQGRALPVLGYEPWPDIPDWLERHACALCFSRDAGITSEDSSEDLSAIYECSCGMQAALLMPEAEPVVTSGPPPDEAIAAFMREIADICLTELDREWDAEARHVARYQGRLVALDFGIPN